MLHVPVPAEEDAMGLFRKRRDEDVTLPPDERSPEPGLRQKDLQVLKALLDSGADLTQPRHVVYYSYYRGAQNAEAAAEEARRAGFAAEVRDPLPDYPDEWGVICELHDTIVDGELVRSNSTFFEEMATRHGGTYDGWEASI